MATHGFRLLAERRIEALDITGYHYRHEASGAELLSLVTPDENKVFGVSFRTPPPDSSGIAHILEHSVLCGSRRFPVKEPFVELLKGSLQTFLNAFTFPDKTCYPVASQNLRDFYNLIEVYLDAAFFPRITPAILAQEGWHYERDEAGRLIRKGVVFNEMKGVYSSPDSIVSEKSQQSLFPDSLYGLDSGGNPREIPALTYEAFKAFHERCYTPGNAYFFFHGDDDPAERLVYLERFLAQFPPPAPRPKIDLQPAFSAPRSLRLPYASGDPAPPNGVFLTVNWLLPETVAADAVFGFSVLEYALIGMPGSPLRKALIDSGLGEDLAGDGLERDIRQMFFSIGLKGVREADTARVETLIGETLVRLAAEGIPADLFEAACNMVEFQLRENNAGSFPRGLNLMVRALTTWLYDGDPFLCIDFAEPLARVRAAGADGLRGLIRRHLLDNPHRATLALVPDAGQAAAADREERAGLDAIDAAMDEGARERMQALLAEVRAFQETPDPPEALAAIPRLALGDLEPRGRVLPLEERGDEGLFLHELPTNGILYADLGFDLSGLSVPRLRLVKLFAKALLESGTRREDVVTLGNRISRLTGGIHAQLQLSACLDPAATSEYLFLRGKAVGDRIPDLFAIFRDLLLENDFSDRGRFRQLVLERKARLEENLVPRGHETVDLRLRAAFAPVSRIAEEVRGLEHLFFLRELLERIDGDWEGLRGELLGMLAELAVRGRMLCNLSGTAAGLAAAGDAWRTLRGALPVAGPAAVGHALPVLAGNEALLLPAQVNYVGRAFRLAGPFHGSQLVAARFLRMGYLWDRVRVRGGAYGAFCRIDRYSGVASLVSYRDPNVDETLAVYDNLPGYLAELELPREELEKAVIGAIGDLDGHLLPDAKGFLSLQWRLVGLDEATRQRTREEVLGTGVAELRAFGSALAAATASGNAAVAVLGGRAPRAPQCRCVKVL